MPTLATDSYVTEAEYQAYADARGIIVNVATLSFDRVKAADFLDRWYNFRGVVTDPLQERSLPTDEVSIANVKNASLLSVQMQQAGLLDLDLAATQAGAVKRIMEKVDVLETEIEYVDGTQQLYRRKTPELDRLLRPFTIGGNGGLVRV